MSVRPTVTTDADGAIVVRIPVTVASAPDALVAYPFIEIGITEPAAAKTLAARPEVTMVKIGRRRHAWRSQLVAAIDALAREQAAERAKPTTKADVGETYMQLVGGGSR